MEALSFTSFSFASAKAAAKKSPGVVFNYDAGDNLEGRVYFCTWRNRVITDLITMDNSLTAPKAAKVSVGDLVTVAVTPTYSIGARVLEIDSQRGVLIRETYPLGTVPSDWEPARFYARPEKVSFGA